MHALTRPSATLSQRERGLRIALPWAIVLGCLVSTTAWGQSSYPMLMDLQPLAAQIGQTSEHEVHSRYNMDGAYKVLVGGTGVTAEIIPADPLPAEKPAAAPAKASGKKQPADKKPAVAAPTTPAKKADVIKLKLRIKVDASALPGVRDFRIATPQGASTIGQLVLVRDPVVFEQAKNDSLDVAQTVTLPATICGVIEKAEDVDLYKFHVANGESLTFHARSARCEDRIHDLQIHVDPIITLKNSTGTVLAMSDNYFFADPLLNYHFKGAGDYYLEIRDVRFQGNAYWQYSIEINDRPLVTNVFPLAVAPEKSTRLEMVGFNLPADPHVSVTVPGSFADGIQWVDLPLGKTKATPAPVVVSRLPLITEASGSRDREHPQEVTLPVGINGRIGKPGEIDYYSFDAKKGQHFTFEVIARRHQSALDPMLAVLNAKGARLVENDDMTWGRDGCGDSLIEYWTVPADGRYTLELRDLHLGGGADFVYFIKATASEPYFTLEVDSDKTLISPGMAAVMFVRVYRRHGFTGPVQLGIEGLPSDVTASCGRILDAGTDGCIILEAGSGAPQGASNVQVTGSSDFSIEGKTTHLTATATPMQETYMPGGGRGVFPVDTHTVSVNAPLDIVKVSLNKTDVKLKPGGSETIEVTIERSPGFDKNVTLDLIYRHLGGISGNSLPAGVTIDDKKSKTLLTGGQSKGLIVLKAAADAAPVEKQQVPVMASVAINFVMKASYVAKPLLVSVTK
jgi:hypothetical protein